MKKSILIFDEVINISKEIEDSFKKIIKHKYNSNISIKQNINEIIIFHECIIDKKKIKELLKLMKYNKIIRVETENRKFNVKF